MNTGIEILIKRIQDCPDDFQYNINTDTSTKWNKLLMEALRSDVITEEEKTALRHEVTEMGRARFTEKVMQALAGVDETSDEGKTPMSIALKHATISDGLTLTSAVADAQKYQTEMMRRQVDALKKVEVRKKATLR